MLDLITKSFYLAVPAYLANMAPVILSHFGWWKFLDRPIDAGRKIGREYIFGAGKTWRGIVGAVIFGILAAWLQAELYKYRVFYEISLFDYSKYFLLFGFLAGLGAILGDLFKSFIKRRLNMVSGQPWPFFDQLDFIVGFLIFTYWLVQPAWPVMLTVFVLTLILHPLTNISAYILKMKKVWW